MDNSLDLLREEESRKEWEHHSSYQWVYFPETAKQLIQFFLSERIEGNNLDLGSGWYSYHPNSTAVDFSKKALDYNLSSKKKMFNLEELGRGKRLPFKDNSFNSSTLVSVWQYIKHRGELMSELERVLSPGSEVFIINERGAGLSEYFNGPSDPKAIADEVKEMGYDAIMETIPFGSRNNPFQSVSVAMPERDLFEVYRSRIKDRTKRIEESNSRIKDPQKFYEKFVLWEVRRVAPKIQKLKKIPITKYSQEYLEKLESVSQELHKKTGDHYLMFSESSLINLNLLLPGEKNFWVDLSVITENDTKTHFDQHDLLKKRGISASIYCNYLGHPSLTGVRRKLQLCSEEEIDDSYDGSRFDEIARFLKFLQAIPLNKFTKELQGEVYETLKPNFKDLDARIERKRLESQLSSSCMEYKQRRKLDEVLATMDIISREEIPIIGHRKINQLGVIEAYSRQLKKDLADSFRDWSYTGMDFD